VLIPVSYKDVILIMLFVDTNLQKEDMPLYVVKRILMNRRGNIAPRGSECCHPTFGQR
jgi:hypothetical protein